MFRITVNRNSKIRPKNIKNVEENIKIEKERIENDEIYNIFRNRIINNINNKIRNKSC